MTPEDFLVLRHNRLASTQSEARFLIDKGECGPNTAIYTAEQTKGVGRHSKSWEGSKGDLAMTLILKPSSPEYEQLAYVAALAVGETILAYKSDLDLKYKWVNDIMISGRKVCGILLEKYKYDLLLVGIGVNILPKNNLEKLNAIGLAEFNINISYKVFFKKLLKNFTFFYSIWESNGFSIIRNKWLEKVFKLGEAVKVNFPGDISAYGIFRSIDCDGKMMLETDGGEIKLISAGETFF